MAIMLTKWERREGTDREELGNAAFVFCREQRGRPGVTDCRFFWTNPDEVAVLAEAESAQVFDEPPKPEMNRAIFHLADMARQTVTERWIDPRDGTEAYRAAGR
jgi:hypothetical protein